LLREKWDLQVQENGRGRSIEDIIGVGTSAGSLISSGGHINFFEDLEQSSMPRSTKFKKSDPVEKEKGVPLAPSAKDLRPWYYVANHTETELEKDKEKAGWDGRT